jgi:hypothetical protein
MFTVEAARCLLKSLDDAIWHRRELLTAVMQRK